MNQPMEDFPLERPPATAGVIVLGIVALLLGLALVSTLGFFILGEATKDLQQGGQPGMPVELQEKIQEIEAEPSRRLTTLVSVALYSLMGLCLVVASIGIFMRRAWAWKLSIASISALLAWVVLSILITQFIVQPRIAPMVDELVSMLEEQQEMPDFMGTMLRVQYGAGGTVVGAICCCLPLPLILFIGLWSPGVRSQFFPPDMGLHADASGEVPPPLSGEEPPPFDPGRPPDPPA